MKRGKPLERRTPLRAKVGLQTFALMRARKAAAEGTPRPARKRPRQTGPSPKVRAIVWARFGGRCAGCGALPAAGSPRSVQHIIARGVGGTNDLTNLVGLCGTATMPPDACHPRCERRDEEMHERRLWLKSTEAQESAFNPLVLWDGTRVFLTADGGYLPEAAAQRRAS